MRRALLLVAVLVGGACGAPTEDPDFFNAQPSTTTTTRAIVEPADPTAGIEFVMAEMAKEQQAREAAAERARRASRAKAARPPVSSNNTLAGGRAVTNDVWWRLALCESGGRNVNTGNGYYGYFQFLPSTWRSVGGTGLPHQHSYEVQREMARRLQARSGWGQWPSCSRKLGLR